MIKTPVILICLAFVGLALVADLAEAAFFLIDPEPLAPDSCDVTRAPDPSMPNQVLEPARVLEVPEPNSLILLGAGLLALGILRRGLRKR